MLSSFKKLNILALTLLFVSLFFCNALCKGDDNQEKVRVGYYENEVLRREPRKVR